MRLCNAIQFCNEGIPGKMNIAAKLLSRLETDPNEKLNPQIGEDITIKPNNVNIERTAISPKEPVFNNADDLTEVPEQDIWRGKAECCNKTSSQPPVITIASYYHTDLPKEPSTVNMAHFNKPSRILTEQNSNSTLLKFKRESLGLPFDDQVLIKDARYVHYFP